MGKISGIEKWLAAENGLNNKELIDTIFSNLNEGIMITNVNKEILLVNPAFEFVTGYTAEEAIGSKPHLLQSGMHEKNFYTDMWQQIYSTGSWSGEIWNRRKTGDIYPEWLTIIAVVNDKGETTSYCGIFEDISEKKSAESEIKKRTNTDMLTGTVNSYAFAKRMETLLATSKKNKFQHALIFLDLDRFGQINESLGHSIGDQLLVEVVERLTPFIRNRDILARYGGDEFVITMTHIHQPQDAVKQAEKIIELFKEPFIIEKHNLYVTASLGISLFPNDGDHTEILINKAVKAMEYSKENGRNQFAFFFEDLKLDTHRSIVLDHELRQAIKSKAFELHYQPKVNAKKKIITGFEALVRWKNDQLGFVSPADFIPYAEETGLIIPLSELIIDQACKDWLALEARGYGHLTIAINISSLHFHQDNFIESTLKLLENNNCSPRSFELELTERTIMNNEKTTTRKLVLLKQLGFKLSIDDFGTGYSSLSYLVQFPLNYLKIDQSFIRQVTSLSEKQAVVDAIIQMAHRLHMEVIAEGVEQLEQVELLQGMGCDMIQGYYYSKPLPICEALAFLEFWKLEIEGK
ncbi:putative bifunctional diguanylate cyclase/phosphodiesterase [Kurthia sibirica]|uniref:GGDEF domain-containing protein n=1 Tax=Kurthia sibirica TaxID=202750 RepID=A0A2U3AI30_9BACL|nr:GGDEF domain-containing phosphodiesterase [Kurthia sibirica]PWI24216.1 GGDEF domain-containing protein [Kurthia sibirica]GEK34113.1 hypothetical protein KSI01_16460 [Kurthia sibirica]